MIPFLPAFPFESELLVRQPSIYQASFRANDDGNIVNLFVCQQRHTFIHTKKDAEPIYLQECLPQKKEK